MPSQLPLPQELWTYPRASFGIYDGRDCDGDDDHAAQCYKQELAIEIRHVNCVEINLQENEMKEVKHIVFESSISNIKECMYPHTTVISVNDERARFLRSSHPIPPAPTTSTRLDDTFPNPVEPNT